jgi:2-polyprenyl-3-methyl-5-hydroxy-6-metoxy-1,4-benzoquinol methylase
MKYKLLKNIETAIKEIKKVGSRFDNSAYWEKYYFEKAGRRDTKRERDYSHFLKRLSYKGTKVLDMATGCGFLPLELYRVGFKVTCLDRYPAMMSLAKKYFAKYGVNLKVIKGDVVQTPFEDKSFDVVTAMSIVEHLPPKEVGSRFLPEISRVLKDEGLVLIHVPVKTPITILKKWARRHIVKDLPAWAIDDDGDVTHTMWLTMDEYSKIIERSGLKIDYVRFNFARSNERLPIMKLVESVGKTLDGVFFDWGQKLSFRYFLLSKMAVSVAFVCHKVI